MSARHTRGAVLDPPAESLVAAGTALEEALVRGGDRLPPAAFQRASDVLARASGRLGVAGDHTVVALAGATGSGKSSLFNDMVGEEVSTVGARRPTTATATAAVWGDDPATGLLDWLQVPRWHHATSVSGDEESARGAFDLGGLVLLDLPDFDSRVVEHRTEVDRLLALVDVFVWVTDPQKYADARLHDDYVRRLARHGATTLVVLNQADTVSPDGLAACRADLERLLVADGVAVPEVLVTSAVDGDGVVDVIAALAQAVQTRTAARLRLLADIRSCAAELRQGVADTEASPSALAAHGLVDALSRAAAVPTVLESVEAHYRRDALARTGWPFSRWVRHLRPDPMRRIGLGRSQDGSRNGAREADPADVTAADVRAVLGRSSLPNASPASLAAVDLATRDLVDRVGEGLPPRWADAMADAAQPRRADLTDALDQAVLATSLRARRPAWWGVVSVLQWLLALTALGGLVWLLVLALLGFLQLPAVDPPRWGPFPYPMLMAVGGLLLGFLLGRLSGVAARRGAKRLRSRIEERLRESVADVASTHVVAPVQAVVDAHRETRRLLDLALR